MDNLWDIIFDTKCVCCRAGKGLLCKDCVSQCCYLECCKYRLAVKSYAPLYVTSLFEYDGPVRVCIKEGKYGKKQFAALSLLTRIGLVSKGWDKYDKGFVCTPIPLNPRKYRTRGFNQAAVISGQISRYWGLEHRTDLLSRSKNTATQTGLVRKDRYSNIQGAFCAEREVVLGRSVLLVDDICTTGATLTEAAATLYKAGAKEVKAFTLARTTI
jgi:ComF family protein